MGRILLEQTTAEQLSNLVAAKVASHIKTFLPSQESIDLLTRQETADLLKISLPTLRKWTVQGRLRSYRIGGRIRYKKTEVLQALTINPY